MAISNAKIGDNPALYIGFIMLMVTPCTDWYLIFTGIAKGNVALSTAILPLNLILQVILLPIYLLIFGGPTGVIELGFLVESILVVLFIPLVLALITKLLLRNRQQLRENFISKLSVYPIVFLSLTIVAMFASQGHLLIENLELIWQITLPLLLFFVINFIVGQKVGQVMKYSYSDRTSLSLTTFSKKLTNCLGNRYDSLSRPTLDCLSFSYRSIIGTTYFSHHYPTSIIS